MVLLVGVAVAVRVCMSVMALQMSGLWGRHHRGRLGHDRHLRHGVSAHETVDQLRLLHRDLLLGGRVLALPALQQLLIPGKLGKVGRIVLMFVG
jgi:hypothetical protein